MRHLELKYQKLLRFLKRPSRPHDGLNDMAPIEYLNAA